MGTEVNYSLDIQQAQAAEARKELLVNASKGEISAIKLLCNIYIGPGSSYFHNLELARMRELLGDLMVNFLDRKNLGSNEDLERAEQIASIAMEYPKAPREFTNSFLNSIPFVHSKFKRPLVDWLEVQV